MANQIPTSTRNNSNLINITENTRAATAYKSSRSQKRNVDSLYTEQLQKLLSIDNDDKNSNNYLSNITTNPSSTTMANYKKKRRIMNRSYGGNTYNPQISETRTINHSLIEQKTGSLQYKKDLLQ